MADLFDYTPPPTYPDAPGFKETTTSKMAAAKITPRAASIRDQVLEVYRQVWPAGLTADEAAAKLGRTEFSIRPRISELRKLEELMPCKQSGGEKNYTRKNETSGSDAIVWVCREPKR